MPGLADFAKIAPYLGKPLVFLAFVVLMFCGIPLALIKAGLLTRLTQKQSFTTILKSLKYGFLLAIIAIALGLLNTMLIQRRLIKQTSGPCSSNNVGNGNSISVDCADKPVTETTK
jgi:ABC-type Fe3+ transport system permease subunit